MLHVLNDQALRSLAFYRSPGFDIRAEEDHACHGLFGVKAHHQAVSAGELHVWSSDPHWQKPTGGQRVNLQFELDSPAAVDATYARLVAAGAGKYAPPWDAFWGWRFGRVTDPDGNVVSLFAELDDARRNSPGLLAEIPHL